MPVFTRNIDVVILCGGKGERLWPVVSDRPKPMAKIVHRPFLDILIGYVSSFGFKRFILCVRYMKEFIKDYYEDKKGIIFSEEKEPQRKP